MFSPDDEKKKKPDPKKPSPIPSGPVTLVSEQEQFGWYLDNGVTIRERYGIKKSKEGIYSIGDLPLIEKLDPHLKNMLREWMFEKQRQGKWKT